MNWSAEALALFAERAIDPAVAERAGVKEDGAWIEYPTGKRRSLNGGGHRNPVGEAKPWWPRGVPERAEAVLITEGETDGLAAFTALQNGPEHPGFRDLPTLAIPGSWYPPDRLVRGLRHYGTRQVYLAMDTDKPGQEAKDRYAAALSRAGIEPLDATPVHDDLAAWLARCENPGECLADLLAVAEPIRSGPPSFAQVVPEPLRLLWRDRIPRGGLSVVAGDPGRGKSLFTCQLAAELSREGKTVLMANADDPAPRTLERLKAAEADLGRIWPLDDFLLPQDLPRLQNRIVEAGADLITLDPWDAFADVANLRRQEVYRALKPLEKAAQALGCAVVVVCHLNRSGDEENPIYRIPVGLRDIARSILMMSVADGKTSLLHRKFSYGDRKPPIDYRFEGSRLSEITPVVAKPDLSGKTNLPDATEVEAKAAALGLEIFDA